MFEFLKEQNISEKLLDEVGKFREFYKLDDNLSYRVPSPKFIYQGKEVWEMAITAILQGEHILLSGAKATGKNVLADNLAFIFNRPSWNVSFNINTDSDMLIGNDTFEDGKVSFKKGPIYLASEYGGFGVLDEINMAKNDAMAVLYSVLDYRRILDVPGYEKVNLNEATRFIGTMNYGYAGTKELNEALVSRFMVIDIPKLTLDRLKLILKQAKVNLNEKYLEVFSKMFLDLQTKSYNSEISSKAVDLRGFINAIKSAEMGLDVNSALKMGIVNKAFDEFEKELVNDVIKLHIPKNIDNSELFE